MMWHDWLVWCVVDGKITVLFLNNTPPPPPRAWAIRYISSKLSDFERVSDEFKSGWIPSIGASVAGKLVETGSGWVGSVVCEREFYLHRRIHTRPQTSAMSLPN